MNGPERTKEASLTLTNGQFAQLAGISESRFYELKAADAIPADLLSPVPNRWSREKVTRWLAEGAPALTRARGKAGRAA